MGYICVSRTNDELSSCDYHPSRRSAPYFPKAFSKSSQMTPPARDYRWNLIRNRSTPVAPVAPVPPAPPVTGNLPLGKSPGLQVRPPTTRRDHRRDGILDAHHSTAFVDGRWVAQFPGGDPRNTKMNVNRHHQKLHMSRNRSLNKVKLPLLRFLLSKKIRSHL